MADYKTFSAHEGNKPVRTMNLALKVSGFMEKNGEVLVEGTSLESGEEVTAKLGATENKKRPTLAQLRDGYKVKGTLRTLQPGGILVLDKAHRQEGETTFTANWPSVMAYTAEDAQKGSVMTGLCSLQVGTNKDGNRYGIVLRHATNPQNFITGQSPQDIREGIEQTAARCSRQSFTIRAIKPDSGKVVAVGQVLSNWNTEQKRVKTPAEMADSVTSLAQKMQNAYPATTLSVIPAIRYSVTSFMLEDTERYERLQKIAATFRHQDVGSKETTYLAKKVCLKLGGEHQEFVNDFKVMDPYAPGIDPAYIAGLVPAHDEAPIEDLDDSHTQEQVTQASKPPASETPDDPFADVPEDDAPGM